MTVTHDIDMDLLRPGVRPLVCAVQGEAVSRALCFHLTCGGLAWTVPEGVTAAVRFGKCDGTGGLYDTLPDGGEACAAAANTVTALLAPQVLTCPGRVALQLELRQEEGVLATFGVWVLVEADPSAGAEPSEDYYSFQSVRTQKLQLEDPDGEALSLTHSARLPWEEETAGTQPGSLHCRNGVWYLRTAAAAGHDARENWQELSGGADIDLVGIYIAEPEELRANKTSGQIANMADEGPVPVFVLDGRLYDYVERQTDGEGQGPCVFERLYAEDGKVYVQRVLVDDEASVSFEDAQQLSTGTEGSGVIEDNSFFYMSYEPKRVTSGPGKSPLGAGEFYKSGGTVSSNPNVSQTQFFDITDVVQIVLTAPETATKTLYYRTYKNAAGELVNGYNFNIEPGSSYTFTPEPGMVEFSMAYYIVAPLQVTLVYGETVRVKTPRTVSIVGDSISTFEGYIPEGYATFYPRGEVTAVEHTWWKQLLDGTGMKLCSNCSWSGSTVVGRTDSTESAYCAASDRRVADLADADGNPPDYILVAISVNDFCKASSAVAGTNVGNGPINQSGDIWVISDAYVLLIKKLMEAYPGAKIYCCTVLSVTGTDAMAESYVNGYPNINPADGGTLPAWNAMIRQIAQNMGCGLIDFAACGINFFNNRNFTLDGLHPNIAGHRMMYLQALKSLTSS